MLDFFTLPPNEPKEEKELPTPRVTFPIELGNGPEPCYVVSVTNSNYTEHLDIAHFSSKVIAVPLDYWKDYSKMVHAFNAVVETGTEYDDDNFAIIFNGAPGSPRFKELNEELRKRNTNVGFLNLIFSHGPWSGLPRGWVGINSDITIHSPYQNEYPVHVSPGLHFYEHAFSPAMIGSEEQLKYLQGLIIEGWNSTMTQASAYLERRAQGENFIIRPTHKEWVESNIIDDPEGTEMHFDVRHWEYNDALRAANMLNRQAIPDTLMVVPGKDGRLTKIHIALSDKTTPFPQIEEDDDFYGD